MKGVEYVSVSLSAPGLGTTHGNAAAMQNVQSLRFLPRSGQSPIGHAQSLAAAQGYETDWRFGAFIQSRIGASR
jgi:hypothetical protein